MQPEDVKTSSSFPGAPWLEKATFKGWPRVVLKGLSLRRGELWPFWLKLTPVIYCFLGVGNMNPNSPQPLGNFAGFPDGPMDSLFPLPGDRLLRHLPQVQEGGARRPWQGLPPPLPQQPGATSPRSRSPPRQPPPLPPRHLVQPVTPATPDHSIEVRGPRSRLLSVAGTPNSSEDKEKWVKVWCTFIIECGNESQLYRTFRDLNDNYDVLRAAVENFELSTLKLYGGRFSTWARWSRTSSSSPWPPRLSDVARFFLEHLGSGAPPTTVRSYLSAFRAFHKTADLVGPDITQSRALTGLSLRNLRRKRLTKRAEPYPVETVILMEVGMFKLRSPLARYYLGHVLFRIHSRRRFRDTQFISPSGVFLTEHYVEGVGCRTKTSERHSTRDGVPFAAPRIGVSGRDWGAEWVALLQTHLPQAALQDGFFGTALTPKGEVFAPKLLSNGASVSWTREILLALGVAPEEAALYTDHSTKSTTLSWARKRGLPENVIAILGDHRQSGVKVAYGRDMLEHPLRLLRGMYAEIREWRFNPDQERGLRMAQDPVVELESLVPFPSVRFPLGQAPFALEDAPPAGGGEGEPHQRAPGTASGTSSGESTASSPTPLMSDAEEELHGAVAAGAVSLGADPGPLELRGEPAWTVITLPRYTQHRVVNKEATRTSCGLALPPDSWVEFFDGGSTPYEMCRRPGCWGTPRSL